MTSNYQSKREDDDSAAATPSYYSESVTPRGASPVWGSLRSRKLVLGRPSGLDIKRLIQVVGVIIGCVVLFRFVRGVFAPHVPRDEVLGEGVVAKKCVRFSYAPEQSFVNDPAKALG